MKLLQQAIEQYTTGMLGRDMPPCFDDKKVWDAWLLLEEEAKTEPRQFPCRDCTHRFQELRCAEDRCLVTVPIDYIARQRA